MKAEDEYHIDDKMMKIEVNLDDTPGEWLGFVMEELFDKGANDVYYTPIYMKKNRPGVLLQVLCSEEELDIMKEVILRETTTLGIRYHPLTVERSERKFKTVETKFGPVPVKVGLKNGEVFQLAPEYEECRTIAKKEKVPLKVVYQEVWKSIESYEGGEEYE
ncbi:nickel pincer cofactor biosynthesis protein LarC2 [Salimicrobium halophilum]|uniref:nickel insertion protein n=1 Tax=Salimicrobium halophilum TaxID=86666 RepID=UPI000AD74A0B|nr:nickel insertion protein [Salimicrobium halophilum]